MQQTKTDYNGLRRTSTYFDGFRWTLIDCNEFHWTYTDFDGVASGVDLSYEQTFPRSGNQPLLQILAKTAIFIHVRWSETYEMYETLLQKWIF